MSGEPFLVNRGQDLNLRPLGPQPADATARCAEYHGAAAEVDDLEDFLSPREPGATATVPSKARLDVPIGAEGDGAEIAVFS